MTHELQSMKSAMYTWDNAIGKRELEWSFGKVKSNKNNLTEVSIVYVNGIHRDLLLETILL